MGLLNTTIFCGLILTKYVDKSPLKTFSHRSFFPSFSFSEFRLSRFTNTALFFEIQSNLLIKKSHFTRFLKTPIIESRPPIKNFERDCRPRSSQTTIVEESTFQICSTDFEADTDNINSSGGALYYDDRQDLIKISQCNFAYCHAGVNGGAIYIRNSTDLILKFTLFQDCTTGFLANRADVREAKGGAVFANVISCTVTACDFVRCTIHHDQSIKRYGGALYFARCAAVSPQYLDIYLSKFDRCGSETAELGISHGGAVYVNCNNSISSLYRVNISYTNFTNCVYSNSGSVVEVVGDTAEAYFKHTSFQIDSTIVLAEPLNYSCVNISNSNPSSNINSSLTLYNISLYDYNVNSANGVMFNFYANKCNLKHSQDNVGSIYLSRDKDQYVLLNKEPLNMLDYVNLYPINDYSYPFIPALYDKDVFKPFPTPVASPLPSRSPLPTDVITSGSGDSSGSGSSPDVQTTTISPGTSNGDDSASGSSKSGGLSTAAIVLIIIACIIVIITIILVSVLCVRNGRCSGSHNQIRDVRSVENDESIRRFTYF